MQSSSSSHPRPAPPLRLASEALLKLLAEITADDIKGAQLCGGGGFSDVYVLTHAPIGKLALKRMRISGNRQVIGEQMRRSAREAETWRQLDHPNILPFLDVLERSDYIYLVSPFVQNGSISDFARQHPDVDRTRMIQEAAAGIAYLHRSGIIHGDIKGANILVSDDVRALLCDFGLARSQDLDTSTEMQGVGSVRWQSPELLESKSSKSFKSDVWAFGMTICEVLSGHVPYHQYDSATGVILAVIVRKQRPATAPEVSPTGISYTPLWEVARECWHEDPDARPDIQEAHKRLILGGFRSLQLSPPPGDEGASHDAAQGVPSPGPLPSSSTLGTAPSTSQPNPGPVTRDQADVGSGLVEHRASPALGDREGNMQAQISRSGQSDNPMAVSVTSDRPSKAGVLGSLNTSVYALEFSPNGRSIVTATGDHTLRLWDVASRSQSGEPLTGHTERVYCLAFSPDGKTIASGSQDRTLRLWDAEAKLQRVESFNSHTYEPRCLAFSPDGKTIATGSADWILRLWDVEARSQRGESLKGHTYVIHGVAFSPDGTTIATASADYAVRLWDVEAGSQIGEPLLGHTNGVRCLAFSPDGKTIATGSSDRSLRLWNLEDRSQRGSPLEGHTDVIYCLAFSPDGATVATGSADKTIRLWDAGAGIQRGKTLEGHTHQVYCMAFSPDGSIIASGSFDHTIRLWDVDF